MDNLAYRPSLAGRVKSGVVRSPGASIRSKSKIASWIRSGYTARRLAYALIGYELPSRVEMAQLELCPRELHPGVFKVNPLMTSKVEGAVGEDVRQWARGKTRAGACDCRRWTRRLVSAPELIPPVVAPPDASTHPAPLHWHLRVRFALLCQPTTPLKIHLRRAPRVIQNLNVVAAGARIVVKHGLIGSLIHQIDRNARRKEA